MKPSMRPTDEALYRRMKDGDREAFAELYDRREPGLYRYALHMTGNVQAAEEIAQEVFLQLMGPGGRYDENRGPLEAWMYGVARNLVRVYRRRGAVQEAVDRAVEHDIVGGMISDESLVALREAVTELPANYREVVVLCDLEERNYDEAARLMACPVGTIRSRLHRARALLATRLRRYRTVTSAGER
ncbi:MAG TPA: RNA polymerase sigma factor [Bryobacteraceae bacterium]|nr:RNA polymerase sigma factor [Bryobacteraceae bacterium]